MLILATVLYNTNCSLFCSFVCKHYDPTFSITSVLRVSVEAHSHIAVVLIIWNLWKLWERALTFHWPQMSCLLKAPCCTWKPRTPLPSEHLGRERRRQVFTFCVVAVDGGHPARQNVQRVFLQDVVHLPLDALRPGEQLSLQPLSRLQQRLLPAAQARQQLQVVVELSHRRVGGDCARWRPGLRPVGLRAAEPGRGLARHVALKLLRGEIETLGVQLLDEGCGAALKKTKTHRKGSWKSESSPPCVQEELKCRLYANMMNTGLVVWAPVENMGQLRA